MPSAEPVLCVIQARMGSTRLPGKVLADLAGRPMLQFMLERLQSLNVDHLVVATSSLDRDDPVAQVAATAGVEVVRGPEDDVLGRYALALGRFDAATVIRLTGDCPLTDPVLVAEVLARHRDAGADYTSNVFPRSYPKGLDVEVLAAPALRAAHADATLALEREHVTPFLYRHPERFRLANLDSGLGLGRERWTVDTPDDLEAMRHLVATMGGSGGFSWRDALAVVGAQAPAPPAGALVLRPVTAADEARTLAWRNDPDGVRFSPSGEPIAPGEHRRWFISRLDNPATRFRIGERAGVAIGCVRVDVEDAHGRVSLTVDGAHRGRGHATALLRAVQTDIAADLQVDQLVADVAPGNEPSRRAFLAAGFRVAGAVDGFDRFTWDNARR